MRALQPGDEYALVDEFARVLKLEGWFEWKPDDGTGEIAGEPLIGESEDTSPQGPTNPELLKAKQPATVLFLLDVLQRFEKMTDEQIKQIGFEIGTRGIEGIDYASTERTYTLKAFPGETFSGLQMLCFMYVAFQRIDPTADIGVDFKDAYAQALKMYGSKSNDGG